MSAVSAAVPASARVVVNRPGEVTISGTLAVHTIAELRARLHGILDGGEGDLVVHLGQADVKDASGLGVLVGLHQRARRAGRRLVIGEASERLERLLRITKLHVVLARLDDRAGAGLQPMPGTGSAPLR